MHEHIKRQLMGFKLFYENSLRYTYFAEYYWLSVILSYLAILNILSKSSHEEIRNWNLKTF